MTISKLIETVGDERVQVQTLHSDYESAQIRKGTGFITFCTEPAKVADMLKGDEREWTALVLWMPKARVDAALRNDPPVVPC